VDTDVLSVVVKMVLLFFIKEKKRKKKKKVNVNECGSTRSRRKESKQRS